MATVKDNGHTEQLIFTVNVPETNDAGFIGFLDDMMNVVELVGEGEMTPAAWRAMLAFLEQCIDSDSPRDAVRSMSMPQMLSTFEQIVEAASVDPKG